MSTEHRKSKRRSLTHHRAAVMTKMGADTRVCVVKDASDTGARLEISEPEDLPDEFTLLLSSARGPKRSCRVVWRDGKTVGVRFNNR